MNKTTTTLFVGRTAEGARMWVSIELRERGAGQTIDHKRVENYTELSITGSLVERGCRSISACGQIISDLATVVDYRDSAFDEAAVGALLILWYRWHLNGMRAACSHMTEMPVDRSYDARRHITCPETGYRYGSAWLVEPLPASIITAVETFTALPAGKVPHYV